MKNPRSPGNRPRKRATRTLAFPFEFRLRVVRLHLEEQYSVKLLAEQFGVSDHSIQRWLRVCRQQGCPDRRL